MFGRGADSRFKWVLWLSATAALLCLVVAFVHVRSDAAWSVGQPARQPIPFSHAVHAGGLELDCRFCHASVERSAAAGMPTAETCLGCHARVWAVKSQFAPLTTALALNTPVPWASVSRLPDHVRFHHGAHLRVGVGCQTCHGAVEEMPRTVKAETLSMGWCVACHTQAATERAGESPLLPASSAWRTITHQGIEIPALTRCSTCHR